MKQNQQYKVLIVEDDFRLAEITQRGLTEYGYEVMLAYDGEYGKRLALEQDIDLILSDIVLPKINGIEFCKLVKLEKPEVPIIMLTALGTTDDKLDAFDAGADDYMVKPFDIRELNARIKLLISRNTREGNKLDRKLQFEDLTVDLKTKTVYRDNTEIHLTPKEFNLIVFMIKNPNRVLSRNEIAEMVWDTHFDTGTNFIDVYINYLRKKIDKPFPRKLIHTKPGMGFILKSEEN